MKISKSLSIFMMVAMSTSAVASTKCQYINEYIKNEQTGDHRVQSYLNFYSKMGAGGPVRIKIPGCISKKSDEAIRKELIESNRKNGADSEETAKSAQNADYKTDNFSPGNESYVYEGFTQESKKSKKFESVKLSHLKGTSTFCKAIVICERDDGTSYLDGVFCRGSSPDKCPNADECLNDNTVAMNVNGLSIEAKDLTKTNSGLEGEQKPSTVLGR